MNNMPGSLDRIITGRPYITIIVLVLITIVLGAGATRRAPPPETAATLPENSRVADVLVEIDELFGDSGEANVVTLVFRGESLTPQGLGQMDRFVSSIVSNPSVGSLLEQEGHVFAPSLIIKSLLHVDSFQSVTQAEIDSVRSIPEIQAVLSSMTGTDTDGTPVSIAILRLQDTGDERIQVAERLIQDLAVADEGPLAVSSVSPIVIEDEYVKATEEGMAPLIGLAFLLIAALILLFMRTFSDLFLTLGGLLMSIIWIVGTEGWLGPNGLGLTGPPNSLTIMVPIIVIGLTVDYAIQIVSHYREQRTAGEGVLSAARAGLSNVTIPLVLAAVTTIISFMANLFSPIGIVGDFGIIAGLGVGMSLIVMLTLMPAGRTIIDRRREARGRLTPPRPIATALPGVSRIAAWLGRSVTNNPAPYIIGVVIVTLGLGFAATNLESEFDIRDILPRGGTLMNDLNTLEAAVGGSTEMATILVKGEATESRTLLNLQDLESGFADEARRPKAAGGPIIASYELTLRDWVTDSGEPGDKYDPELAALFRDASAGVQLDPALMQEILDKLEARDPSLSRILVNDPNGPDAMLLQFRAINSDPSFTKVLQQEIEGLWFGEDDTITATSESIISVTVTDSITERQTEAITSTILAALTVLAVFFWVTVRQPALAIIAVGPIVLVLIAVLGTMALLGIPYTIITSIITALSIGIGVDYTIHMIHRYREEYSAARDPERAAIRTLSTTGSALLGSALTTGLGLGALVFSPLAASQQFGITAGITIAYSLIVSIIMVPPMMTVWGAYQNMRLRSVVQRWSEELDEAIEAVHRRHEQ